MVLVDTDAAGKQDLLRLLKRYRLRQKLEIDDASAGEAHRTGGRAGGGCGEAAGGRVLPACRAGMRTSSATPHCP